MPDFPGVVDDDAPPATSPDVDARFTALTRTLSRLVASLTESDGTPTEPWPMPTMLGAMLTELLPSVAPARWASITLRTHAGSAPFTGASTDDLAARIDELQYAALEGPCLDATNGTRTVVPDLTSDGRWPRFAQHAVACSPVRCALSVPIPVPAEVYAAAVNLYGTAEHALTDAAVPAAELAAAVVAGAAAAHAARWHAYNLERALETSRTIGAAVGIVMAGRRITYDAAYDLLRSASQRSHRKVRDVADDVLVTGELPAER